MDPAIKKRVIAPHLSGSYIKGKQIFLWTDTDDAYIDAIKEAGVWREDIIYDAFNADVDLENINIIMADNRRNWHLSLYKTLNMLSSMSREPRLLILNMYNRKYPTLDTTNQMEWLFVSLCCKYEILGIHEDNGECIACVRWLRK